MDEAIAYQWTAQALRQLDAEPHKGQQIADSVASAIFEAYKLGMENNCSGGSEKAPGGGNFETAL